MNAPDSHVKGITLQDEGYGLQGL